MTSESPTWCFFKNESDAGYPDSEGLTTRSPDEGAVPGLRQDGRMEAAMSWLVLVVSGVLEAVWATALGKSEGFARPTPSVVFVTGLVLSMLGLAYAMRELPTGTSYVVWVGVGAVGTVAWAMLTGDESASPLRILLLAGIVVSIVGLKLAH